MVLTYISLLIPAFSLPLRPPLFPLRLRPCGALLYQFTLKRKFHRFGVVF